MLPDLGLSKSLIKFDNNNNSDNENHDNTQKIQEFEDEYSSHSQISFYLLPRFTTKPKPSYLNDHLLLPKQKPYEDNHLICRFQEFKMIKTKR